MVPLPVLWLGLLLFGLLYTHAASPEATVRHTPGVSSAVGVSAAEEPAPAPGAGEAGGHHGGHGSHQYVDDCALGQPEQGPELTAPCLSPLDTAWGRGVPVMARTHGPAARDMAVSIPPSADPTVLRL